MLCIWTCSSSFCVITASTVQLQIVQFVQYLYSKYVVLLCSWTWSNSFCVITVSTVQLQTLQFVQYLYSKCAVIKKLNMTGTVSLCEQESLAAIYITCVTFCVSSGKNGTEMWLWVPPFLCDGAIWGWGVENYNNSISVHFKIK